MDNAQCGVNPALADGDGILNQVYVFPLQSSHLTTAKAYGCAQENQQIGTEIVSYSERILNLSNVVDSCLGLLCVRSEGDSVASYTVSRIMGEDAINDLILFLTSCILSLIFIEKTKLYNENSTKIQRKVFENQK